ncbi:hypothetical protein HPB50_004848 [Hyalomma asiaticum]|uniref:Uncharacterized protein n=1 Tax=Hyalomma asiaticum TaxID=266040 RepID=A0ACB7SCJ3_HYAAI|nr:hypothetical protein HPB50_004848 [Hyalomma asiaticum]
MQRDENSGYNCDLREPRAAPPPQVPRTEAARPTACKPPPKVKIPRRCRKKSKVYLVPYEPTLSPIFEESQCSPRQDIVDPCSQPLLYVPFARHPTYGVFTAPRRLNRVVITVEEKDSEDKAWPERVARILTLTWFLMSLSALVLLGGATMIWVAFAEGDAGGGSTYRNVVTAFVGIGVFVIALMFVLWNAFRGLH